MEQTNYYKVLQVDSEAEAEVVKAAYRALSRKYHPDGTHPSTERMKRLNDAYAVLSDPQTRARYNDAVEDWGGRVQKPGSAAPVVPPMRYRDTTTDVPRPRRPARRNPYGVATQVLVGAFCLLALVFSGILRPLAASPSPTPAPTPTPPAYRQTADILRTAFEGDGFTFADEFTPAGELLQRGDDVAQVATVYISQDGGSIQYASLLLSTSEDRVAADQAEQDLALSRLLDATFGTGSGRDQAQEWISARQSTPSVDASTTISGWLIHIWSAPAHQAGIVIRPDIKS